MFGAVVALVLLAWCPGKMELVLTCVSSEPPESHIHGPELSFGSGIVVYSRCGLVVCLDWCFGLDTTHFNEIFLDGYHSFVRYEEACNFSFSS